MTVTKKHSVDEIVEAMVDNLGSDSLKELFHKTAGMGPCTFCGKFGHEQKNCPKVKKYKEEMKKKKEKKNKEQKADTHECPGAKVCDVCKKAEAEEYALKSLAAVADTLDKQGFTELANILDESIEKVAISPEYFAEQRKEEAEAEERFEAAEEYEATGEPDIDEAKAKALGVLDAIGMVYREEEPDYERLLELQKELEAANATFKMLKERGMPR